MKNHARPYTLRQIVVTSVLAVSTSAVNAATVLVSNVEETTRALTDVSSALWAAQSFVTDATPHLLGQIETILGSASGSPAVVAELRADQGLPGLGATLTTFSLSVSSGAPTLTTLTPASSIPLLANTAYWLVIGATSGAFQWAYAEGNATTGPGTLTAYGYSNDQGVTWPAGLFNSENPYQVRIQVTPVPEPARVALMIAGLVVVLGAQRMRARRRSV